MYLVERTNTDVQFTRDTAYCAVHARINVTTASFHAVFNPKYAKELGTRTTAQGSMHKRCDAD